jgi:hypothetical protein
MRFRSKYKHAITVEVIGECIIRQASTRKSVGVIYKRVDTDEGYVTVRNKVEFEAKFERIDNE